MNRYVIMFSDDGTELWTGRIDGLARTIMLPPMDGTSGAVCAEGRDDGEDRDRDH